MTCPRSHNLALTLEAMQTHTILQHERPSTTLWDRTQARHLSVKYAVCLAGFCPTIILPQRPQVTLPLCPPCHHVGIPTRFFPPPSETNLPL